MAMDDFVRSMRDRMPWPVGQRLLRENGLPRGQGWDKTVERLTDPEVDYSDKEEVLEDALKEHLLCGEKLVRFYEVSKKASTEMMDTLADASIPESPFKDAYPALLPESDLEEQSGQPVL